MVAVMLKLVDVNALIASQALTVKEKIYVASSSAEPTVLVTLTMVNVFAKIATMELNVKLKIYVVIMIVMETVNVTQQMVLASVLTQLTPVHYVKSLINVIMLTVVLTVHVIPILVFVNVMNAGEVVAATFTILVAMSTAATVIALVPVNASV